LVNVVGGERAISELKGNTLRVYWHLLRINDSTGPREIQRKLNFSSPALAAYHLEKLVELGLVEKGVGEYKLVKIVDVGVIRHFMRLRGFMFPRNILYATMFTSLLVFFLLQMKHVNFYSVFALIFGFLGTGILWYEAVRMWQSKP
jgi:hypothetical protein